MQQDGDVEIQRPVVVVCWKVGSALSTALILIIGTVQTSSINRSTLYI